MAEQKKGQINIFAKNIRGNASGGILEESRYTRNIAGGMHVQNGGSGVSNNTNQPRKPALELRVLKIDGPFEHDTKKKADKVEKGKWYSYKVTQFNRTPKKEELQHLKWATEYNADGKISY